MERTNTSVMKVQDILNLDRPSKQRPSSVQKERALRNQRNFSTVDNRAYLSKQNLNPSNDTKKSRMRSKTPHYPQRNQNID